MRLSSSRRLSLVFLVLASLIPSIVFAQAQLQLHPNKTIFTPGEQIWFSAYMFDEYESPLWGNQLVRIQLVDESGHSIREEKFQLNEGVGYGNILVDKSVRDNRLFLVGEVLQEKGAVAPIRDILQLNLLNPPSSKKKLTKGEIPFQWVSESGAILSGQQNTLIVQLPEIGKEESVRFYEGSKALPIRLKSQWKGIGQLTYFHDSSQEYKFIVQRKGRAPEYYPVVPSSSLSEGLRINNLEEESVRIAYLGSGKTGMGSGELEFWLNGKTRVSGVENTLNQEVFSIPRQSLPEGVVEVRYIVRGQMRGQNWFVNQRAKEPLGLQVMATGSTEDSTSLRIQHFKKEPSTERLSAIVLSREAYDRMRFRNLRLMEMLGRAVPRAKIPPFGRAYSRNQQARLDHWLRLCMVNLPQGSIDQKPDQWISGYPLKGKVFGETASKATQVLVQSKRGVFALAPIQAKGSFELNLMPKVNDTLFSAALDETGKPVLDSQCEIQMNSIDTADHSADLQQWLRWFEEDEKEENRNRELELVWPEAQIALEEVVLTAPAKAAPKFQIDALTEGRIITAEDEKNYVTLATYLRRLGYRVQYNEGKVMVISRGIGPGSSRTPVVVPVFINGMFSEGYELFQIPLTSIQSLVYDSMRRLFISIWLKPGIQKVKSCYWVPQEGVTENSSFEKNLSLFRKDYLGPFGSLLWEPSLSFEENENVFKIPTVADKGEYVLILRGLDEKNRIVDEHIPFSIPEP